MCSLVSGHLAQSEPVEVQKHIYRQVLQQIINHGQSGLTLSVQGGVPGGTAVRPLGPCLVAHFLSV